MSKTFTAALILGLVEDGKLQPGREGSRRSCPASRWARPEADPAAITVRMLLDHTSGLADFFFGKGVDAA